MTMSDGWRLGMAMVDGEGNEVRKSAVCGRWPGGGGRSRFGGKNLWWREEERSGEHLAMNMHTTLHRCTFTSHRLSKNSDGFRLTLFRESPSKYLAILATVVHVTKSR